MSEGAGFQRFARHTRTPTIATKDIRISKAGDHIRLPLPLLTELSNPTHVVFLHNAQTNEIALQPAGADDLDAYRIRRNGRITHVVSAKHFLRSIGSPPAGTYPARIENGLIIASLTPREA